jgi:hypothetical protein
LVKGAAQKYFHSPTSSTAAFFVKADLVNDFVRALGSGLVFLIQRVKTRPLHWRRILRRNHQSQIEEQEDSHVSNVLVHAIN